MLRRDSSKFELFITLPRGSVGNGIRFDANDNMFVADYKKHNISFGGHLTELAKIRDEAIKSKSYSAATNAEKARGAVGGLYIEQKIIRTGKIEDLSEDELNERINTIVSDNSLLLDKKEENKTPQEKKPKPILS